MSGHSKWAQIKRQKGAADKKKGQLFSKLSRSITLAAKNGGDPSSNFKLRLELVRAKEAGMPQTSIDRAVKKGTGEDKDAAQIEEVIYEGYGPKGSAFLILAATDNRNRTSSNIRHIFTKHGGNLAGQGSVAYLFSVKGQILVAKEDNNNLEEIQLAAIDLEAEDVKESEDGLEIYTEPKLVEKLKEQLESKGVKIASFETAMQAESEIEPNDKTEKIQIEKLIEALEEDEDVISVNTNVDL